MNKTQVVLDKVSVVFTATEEVLSEWSISNSEGNLQFPALLGMMAIKMNWDEKQVRDNDPMIRYFVRNNPDYYVTRGAHGGIMKVSDREKKEAERIAKITAKEAARQVVDANLVTSDAVTLNQND